ncbi:hypothetical protein DSO57_1018713 [Entomophthora muscae]|uniref:Uncharacterized protein n=1 Tax=Entomophthora muscae TaxID=34485 RepID=A0ACC2UPL8_9FUNG|nr:hypothetical protein DSO57_1018713 [Entomophthora muscae]
MSPINTDKYTNTQSLNSVDPHFFHQVFNSIPSEIRKGPREYVPDASEVVSLSGSLSKDSMPTESFIKDASDYSGSLNPETDMETASMLIFPRSPSNSTTYIKATDDTTSTAFTICAAIISALAFIVLLFFCWRFLGRRRRNFLLRSTSSESVSVHTSFNNSTPEKCLGSSRLGSLRQAVTGSFRNSRRQSNEPYKISSSHRQDSFEVNRWTNGTKIGLSEVELSQILSSPSCDQPMLSAGESAASRTTLPTDSWDQYMSILKHEEHLHFEDITPAHTIKNASAEVLFHRDHPSLLSHYFHSTFGGLNRIEPFNGLAAAKGSLVNIKATQEFEMKALNHAPAVSIFHRKKAPSKVSLFDPKNNNSLALTQRVVSKQILDHPTTATAECGIVLKPTHLSISPSATVPTPPLSPSAHWSQPDPFSQLLHSPTAASMPEFHTSKPTGPPVTTPASAKLNPAGWSSPHLVSDLNRLPVLLEAPHP